MISKSKPQHLKVDTTKTFLHLKQTTYLSEYLSAKAKSYLSSEVSIPFEAIQVPEYLYPEGGRNADVKYPDYVI
jgi:hypothetical protein